MIAQYIRAMHEYDNNLTTALKMQKTAALPIKVRYTEASKQRAARQTDVVESRNPTMLRQLCVDTTGGGEANIHNGTNLFH